MIEYIILFFAMILNALFRSWNIRCIARQDKLMAHVSWMLYGVVFLASVTIGIKSVQEMDWIGIFIWFAGSAIGQELSMRNYQNNKS